MHSLPIAASRNGEEIELAGVRLLADISGALYWPEERILVAADLHLEKGSALAARGVMLPPYDSAVTLAKLASAIARFEPLRVISLGDSFHDQDGAARLPQDCRDAISGMQHGRHWLWISGNHDPARMPDTGGDFTERFQFGPFTFSHQPAGAPHEIVGHFHPVARVSVRGRSLRRRCFAVSGTRMVMPAFGALTGGFNVLAPSFADVLGESFFAHLIGDTGVYRFASSACLPD